jgi:hypothetical protein
MRAIIAIALIIVSSAEHACADVLAARLPRAEKT